MAIQNTAILKIGGGLTAVGGASGAGFYAWKSGLLDSIFGKDQTSLIVSVAKESGTSGFVNGKHKCKMTSGNKKELFDCDLSLLTGKYQYNTGNFVSSTNLADEASLSVSTNNFQLKVDKTWDDVIKASGTPTTIDLVSIDGQTKYAVLTPKIKTSDKYIETNEGLMLLIKKGTIADDKLDELTNYKLNVNETQKESVKLFNFIQKPKDLNDIKSNNFLFIPQELKDKETLKSNEYFLVFLKDVEVDKITTIEYKTTTSGKDNISFTVESVNTAGFFEKYAVKEQFSKNTKSFIVTSATAITTTDKSTCSFKNTQTNKSIYCSIHALSVDATKKTINNSSLTSDGSKVTSQLTANTFYKLNIYLPEQETINFDTSKIQIDNNATNLLTIVADIKEKKTNNKHILVTTTTKASASEAITDADSKCKLVDNTQIDCKVYKLATETTDVNQISFASTTKISNTNQTDTSKYYLVDFSTNFETNKNKLTNENLATITLLKNASTDATKQSTLAFKSSVAGTFDSTTHSNNKIFYFL